MNDIPLEARALLCCAGIGLFAATLGGAVGSHALTHLEPRALASFATAVQFLFFHGLGLIAITAVALRAGGNPWLFRAGWVIVLGTVLFCGSIVARTFGAPDGVVALAPYGGVALMLGWLLFAIGVWRRA